MGYKIEHERPNCIGCSACAGVCPDFWQMDSDGKSRLVGGTDRPDEVTERVIGEADLQPNMDAAQSCPVNVIHITNESNGEKVI